MLNKIRNIKIDKFKILVDKGYGRVYIEHMNKRAYVKGGYYCEGYGSRFCSGRRSYKEHAG